MNDATTLDVEHLGLGGSPGRSHWLPQIHYLRTHINSMRQLPCHYILTCHMEFMEDAKTGGLKMYPKVTKSLKPELPAWFNETYYCFRKGVKDGRVSYRWLTAGTGEMDFFKSTLNNKGLYWRDPIVVNLNTELCGFKRLFAYRFGELEDPRLKGKEKENGEDGNNETEHDEGDEDEFGEEFGVNNERTDKSRKAGGGAKGKD